VGSKIFTGKDAGQAREFARLVWSNPFSGERHAIERQILGLEGTGRLRQADFKRLLALPGALLEGARERLPSAGGKHASDFGTYQELVFFHLFHQLIADFDRLIAESHQQGHADRRIAFYDRYLRQAHRLLPEGPGGRYEGFALERLFAVFFQVRRAYYHIVHYIIGDSPAATRLRARVWQSIFTRNMERYQRALTERLGDIITLITGPSGSGKELVARGIGLSRFIPFNPGSRHFEDDFIRAFYPVNLSALSGNLIESELFGHRKGAFTGALNDRKGYFATCGPYGTVFLDEIGEAEGTIQVKLLRVLQTRMFTAIGDTEPQTFSGKIMAATNRDLMAEMRAGRFREDLYFRLNADCVETPCLQDILAGSPAELERLVGYIATKLAGPEAPALTAETCDFIEGRLPADYAWPGNFRELEQCVRNVLVHGDYAPQQLEESAGASGWQMRFERGDYTASQLLTEYVTRLYRDNPNYEELGRRLQLDRRTIKKYVREG